MTRLLNAHNLTALGWSLLNGVWQMGLLWLGYLLLTGNHKRFSSAIRHNLGLMFSGLGSAWFLFCLVNSLVSGERSVALTVPPFFSSRISVGIDVLLSVLTLIYLMVLAGWTSHHLLAYYRLHLKKKWTAECCPATLQLFSNRIIPALGIRKEVNIRMVNWTNTAQTVGFFKPLIFLPIALVNRLSMQQVETILLHELLHIRRYDYLTNMGMTIFRVLFFFNPFVHFFFKTVAREREHACDDGVLQWHYPGTVYAEALFALEKFRQAPSVLSLAADGHNPRLLLERIRRVIGQPATNPKPLSSALSCCLAVAVFVFALNSFSRFSNPVALSRTENFIVQTSISYRAAPKKTAVDSGSDERLVMKAVGPPARPMKASLRKIKTIPPVPEESGLSLNATRETNEMMASIESRKDQLLYADHAEIRNYSNQQAEAPEQPMTVNFSGSPYVPAASFLYLPAEDSLTANVLLLHKLKALAAIDKSKAAEIAASINAQISRQIKQLLQMEKESRQMIEQQEKNRQPQIHILLDHIRRKKAEIDQLNQLLLEPNREIINI
jgi:beta-lactamase regulating signal transducer with metallopeptidase domain